MNDFIPGWELVNKFCGFHIMFHSHSFLVLYTGGQRITITRIPNVEWLRKVNTPVLAAIIKGQGQYQLNSVLELNPQI